MRLSFFAGRLRAAVAPFFCAALIATASLTASRVALAQDTAAKPQVADAAAKPAGVVVHATWDTAYIYFSFQVADTDVTGTNTRPFSHPEQDDSVGVYFETGGAKPDAPDANTHAMIVSVAQGVTLLDGDPATKTLVVPQKPDYSIKYGVTVQGTLNRSDDHDQGYTITMAVPLTVLGLSATTIKPGQVLGFNAVIRSRTAAQLTSLASAVKTEADVPDPAKWSQLTLLAPDGKGGAHAEGIDAPEVDPKGSPPLIDGGYRELEWPIASAVTFASPDKPHEIVVVAPTRNADFAKADSVPPVLDLSKPIAGMQKLLFARYIPTYQADKRRTNVPQRGVFGPAGEVILPDQPVTGVGPWMSSDRLSWHKDQLSEMRHAGIDVALVQIGGPNADHAAFDEKAVRVMVSALRDLAAAGTPAPQVALYLNTDDLGGSPSAKLDLTVEGRDLIYGAVRRWMQLVPPEFRARVLVPGGGAADAVVSAFPVFLASPAGTVTGAESADWADTIRARFATDFGPSTSGTTLLFVGVGSDWTAAGAKVAGVLPPATGKGTGAISTFLLQPGSEQPGAAPVSRKAGATYQAAWEAALAADPTWIVIDSWNDFSGGTEIAASRQYGPQYLDLTRVYAIQASGLKPQDVRWLDDDAPRRMFPGEVVTTTVQVQNVGMAVLRGEEGISLVYRWRQNGAVVAEGPLGLPLRSPLFPTRDVSYPIGLAAAQVDKDGHFAPLAPGDYVAEIDLVQTASDTGKKTYFSENGGSPALRLPITITADLPDYVQFYGTTCPAVLRSGETVPVRVRLRWMGSTTLGLTDASLVYQITTPDGKTAIKSGTVPLPAPLPPGQWVTVPTSLVLSDATVALPPANPELRRQSDGVPGSYRIRWLLTRTQSVAAIPGEYEESVAVYPAAEAAQIMPPVAPPTTYDVDAVVPLDVRIVNAGATKWAKGAFSATFHWYDADGLEVDWKPLVSTAIDEELKPGDGTIVPVRIRVPNREGDFVLALDVLRNADQAFLSTQPVSRTGDIGLLPISVRGGNKLRFVDLSTVFNTDAVAGQAKPGDGDIDGLGDTFPAESFPPDPFGIVGLLSPPTETKKGKPGRDMTAYPSGYYYESDTGARQVAFRYGSDIDGEKNAVTCAGQTIEIEHGRYIGIHIAATATGGAERPLTLVLHFRDGSTQAVTRPVADWNHLPGPNDTVAITTHLKRGKDGDTVGPCTVWHLIFAANVARELTGVTLPTDGAIKVFAVTLERPG